MKLNWKVRIKNPLFWLSLIGVVLTAIGQTPESFTSWESVREALLELIRNPYLLGSALMAIVGVLMDPTTRGLCDSVRALGYDKPEGRR